jgi:uncharacterized membrane protein YeiH
MIAELAASAATHAAIAGDLGNLVDERTVKNFVLALDLAGTFVFAISGAMLGIRERLDIFGVLVLAVAASTTGGIVRDVLIGATPPAALADWRYVVVALAAGGVTSWWYSPISRLQTAILVFDAGGLAFFAVAGAHKAVSSGLNPLAASLLGMMTGIGGGIARDLLVVRTPVVLQRDLYAIAALLGAAITVAGSRLDWPILWTTVAGAAACFGLRVIAIKRGWGLPTASAGERDRVE